MYGTYKSIQKGYVRSISTGAVDGFGEMEEEILPESHIDRSLNTKGAVAYEAFANGDLVGGAIVVIDQKLHP